MLKIILIAFPYTFLLITPEKKSLKGEWELNLITVNSDTIFSRDNYLYTLKYNLGKNIESLKSIADSLTIDEKSKENYKKLKTINILFDSDSTYKITKVRGGGKIYSEEKDSGIYTIQNDTVIAKNLSRNNSITQFFIATQNLLYLKERNQNTSIYQEYIRKR